MIKQIQLRGISRTPSDRLSEDGGLSESLNMFMDTAENAPAFVPEDVTKDLKLPADLQAERIFIHKTANYENFIVVQSDRVVAYTPDVVDDEPIAVMTLKEGESIIDINSLGNTLIFSTTKNIYYMLYRDREYSFLGNKVPFPNIDFKRQNIFEIESLGASVSSNNNIGKFWFLQGLNSPYIPDQEDWNANASPEKEHDGNIRNCLNGLWAVINESLLTEQQKGKLTSAIIVRYEIDVYGSSLSSMPILIPSPFGESLTAHISTLKTSTSYNDGEENQEVLKNTKEEITLSSSVQSYDIFAQLSEDWEYENWRDLITTIRIYISKPIDWGVLKYSTQLTNRVINSDYTNENNYTYISDGDVTFIPDPNYLEHLLNSSALTFMVKEIPIFSEKGTVSDDFKALLHGGILDVHKFIDPSKEDYVQLETQDRIEQDDMKHYVQTSDNLDVYNNQLLLINPSQIIDYDYNRLNAYDIVEHESSGKPITTITYDVTYILKGYTEDKVVKKQFSYVYSVFADERIYAFQIFPDSRAYKMIVKATIKTSGAQGTTEIKYGEFDMYPHPYLDCAYYYGGVENELVSLCTQDSAADHPINAVDDLENKLLVSKMDDPFIFPLTGRFTFQSKVLGVGVATTALSQGQFGQFPLYVFTEDGIWAMETAADGSFITQKPLSREVCINPDSICSIDNAVVFTTEKAVMMISGSQVMNISPYMNGKHFIPNESAVNLIKRQDGFAEFELVIKDDDPFMKFMRDAKTAYDYTGQRLIFISPTNKGFQYVYKIDTQTWHKIAFDGLDLQIPLNSFPECLVQAKSDAILIRCIIRNTELIPDETDVIFWNEVYDATGLEYEDANTFLFGNKALPVDQVRIEDLEVTLVNYSLDYEFETKESIRIFSLSTVLDASRIQETAKGILITRPFDLGMPDVFKSITKIKIRGDYDKDNVKFILQGSDNGRDFYTLTSLRGKSWKMFRIFILADLEPTERISWIDIDFEPRYQNKLR